MSSTVPYSNAHCGCVLTITQFACGCQERRSTFCGTSLPFGVQHLCSRVDRFAAHYCGECELRFQTHATSAEHQQLPDVQQQVQTLDHAAQLKPAKKLRPKLSTIVTQFHQLGSPIYPAVQDQEESEVFESARSTTPSTANFSDAVQNLTSLLSRPSAPELSTPNFVPLPPSNGTSSHPSYSPTYKLPSLTYDPNSATGRAIEKEAAARRPALKLDTSAFIAPPPNDLESFSYVPKSPSPTWSVTESLLSLSSTPPTSPSIYDSPLPLTALSYGSHSSCPPEAPSYLAHGQQYITVIIPPTPRRLPARLYRRHKDAPLFGVDKLNDVKYANAATILALPPTPHASATWARASPVVSDFGGPRAQSLKRFPEYEEGAQLERVAGAMPARSIPPPLPPRSIAFEAQILKRRPTPHPRGSWAGKQVRGAKKGGLRGWWRKVVMELRGELA